MKKKTRKVLIMPGLLALLLSLSTTAKAQEITQGDITNGKYTTAVSVSATIGSSFTVSLPADMILWEDPVTKGVFIHASEVGVKGKLIQGANVLVEADEAIILYDVTNRPDALTDALIPGEDDQSTYEHKAAVGAIVTKEEYIWSQEQLQKTAIEEGSNYIYDAETGYHKVPITVQATGLTSGTWEGSLTFTVTYTEDDLLYTRAPGLYDSNYDLVKSWDLMTQDGSIEMEGTIVEEITTSLSGMLVFPKSVTAIKSSAARGSKNLTQITFEEGSKLTNIGQYAFADCTALTKVTLPEGLVKIDEYVFSGCSKLSEINIPATVTSIGNSAFSNCGLDELYVPATVTSIGTLAFTGIDTVYYSGSASGSPWSAKLVLKD